MLQRSADFTDLVGVPYFVRRRELDPLIDTQHSEETVFDLDRAERETITAHDGRVYLLTRTIEISPGRVGLDRAGRHDGLARLASFRAVPHLGRDVLRERITRTLFRAHTRGACLLNG